MKSPVSFSFAREVKIAKRAKNERKKKSKVRQKKRYINNILLVVGRGNIDDEAKSRVIEAQHTISFYLLHLNRCSRKTVKEENVGQVNKLRQQNNNTK